MGLAQLWRKIKKTESFKPARIIIPAENISPPLRVSEGFERNKHYFEVRVNQMYLTDSRKWFTTWEPIVMVASKFLYGGKLQEVPYFLGQKFTGKNPKEQPQGMVFENQKVAGLHPYRGDDFSVSVILGRSKKNDYLKKVLALIENVSNTYLGSFGSAVLPYVNIGKIAMESFEQLIDSQDVEPMIGHEITLSPDTGSGFNPGYFALINEDEKNVDHAKFFVKDGRLHYGNSIDNSQAYRTDDYVLYSILATESRSDVEKLPYFGGFRSLTEDFIGKIQGRITEEQEKEIKGRLTRVLYEVYNSPDLNRAQVTQQIQEFKDYVNEMIDLSRTQSGDKIENLDPRDEWEKDMDKKILALFS